jgi:two-component system sensor histidine kinase KdpD
MFGRHRRSLILWLLWVAALAVLVAILVPSREQVEQTHAALMMLLIVLGASATVGFAAGVSIALLAFALLSYYFESPFDTIDLPKGVDLIELTSFLIVAVVAARLLAIARTRATLAETRAREIERLAAERTSLATQAAQAEGLAEANRMKDALLATVSHDLHTPLTTIRALAGRRSVAEDADWSLVQQETDRLAHLVRELLDYSRIRGGALPVRIETYPAEDLVGAVARECAHRLNTHTLHTHVPMAGPVLAGVFDLVLSTRVLVNLVENAAKYGTTDSRIDLHVERVGAALRFSVSNEGAVIADVDRERIFEPFTRGGSALTQSRVHGVGLGLAIARALTEAQAGSLALAVVPDTARPGVTTFVLTLPATDWTDMAPDAPQDGPLTLARP